MTSAWHANAIHACVASAWSVAAYIITTESGHDYTTDCSTFQKMYLYTP